MEEEAFIIIKYRLCWEIAQSCFDYNIKNVQPEDIPKERKNNLLCLKPFCITKAQRRSIKRRTFHGPKSKDTVFAIIVEAFKKTKGIQFSMNIPCFTCKDFGLFNGTGSSYNSIFLNCKPKPKL